MAPMNGFSDSEVDYLRASQSAQRHGHLAVVCDDEQRVLPVGFTYDEEQGTIEIGAPGALHVGVHLPPGEFADAALVVDDLASIDPWCPRGIEVRGPVETLKRPPRIRIWPERVRSWGLEQPV